MSGGVRLVPIDVLKTEAGAAGGKDELANFPHALICV